MSDPNKILSADDPRLTAYALGELEGAERGVVEAAVRNDPVLRAVVAEIQSFGGELAQTLEAEDAAFANPSPGLEPDAKISHEAAGDVPPPRGKLLRFPALYYVFATAAAAGFAVMVALHSPTEAPFRARQSPMQVHFTDQGANETEEGAGATAAPALVMAEAAERKAEMPQRPVMPEMEKRVTLAQIRPPVNVAADLSIASTRRTTADGFVSAKDRPMSTFPIEVDTAGYLSVRRFLKDGKLPPVEAVRIEELLNYFPYSYKPPVSGATPEATPPFAANLEVAAAPWAPDHRLVRVALKGREVGAGERGPATLVFLIDVSGSMNAPGKLPLVKHSLQTLLPRLHGDDRIAIVTYAGESGLVLPATPVRRREEILASLEKLEPAHSVHGSGGIQLAYDIAKANQSAPGLTRVILCTDGDFDTGIAGQGELVRLIEEKARDGVSLTVLGFGMGSYMDGTVEQLARKGGGTHGYADSRREAERLMIEQVDGALATIARDVKIQVEFNPANVAQYRLIGYEKHGPVAQDFARDSADVETAGSGHSVTALYEVIPAGPAGVGAAPPTPPAHPGQAERIQFPDTDRKLLTVRVGYKDPAGDTRRILEFSLADGGQAFEHASPDFQFAAAVAAFGMMLRESPLRGSATYAAVSEWGASGPAHDPDGYRAEFMDLVQRARHLVR
ncbi:MAG: von Willebrand factor type A domain-containing protein [Opitutaceae bacterium]|nr:von Willebrand factor type A domain-containing protein [Opitutaceae bacterium]